MSPTKAPVFTHEVDVVGLGFRMKREFRKTVAKYLHANRSGIRVKLVREQTNRFDINAIMVKVVSDNKRAGLVAGQHLGYLRADTAAILAPVMDCREDGGFVFKQAVLKDLYESDDNKSGTLSVEFFDYRSLAPTL